MRSTKIVSMYSNEGRAAVLLARGVRRCWGPMSPESVWEPVELEEFWRTLYETSRSVGLAQVKAIRSSPENRPATSWMVVVGREIYEFESMSHAIIAEVVKGRGLHAFNPRDLWRSDRFLEGAKDSAIGQCQSPPTARTS